MCSKSTWIPSLSSQRAYMWPVLGAAVEATASTVSPGGVDRSWSLRITHTGVLVSITAVRSPPAISPRSGMKLPESASTRKSRLWVTQCAPPRTFASLTGQRLTVVPVPSQWTTSTPWVPEAMSMTSFTDHMQSRSGSTTGCADDNRNGSTPPIGSAGSPQLSRCPTSPRKPRVAGSTSAGRPTSQVANSRSPHGRGAVLAWLGTPKGEVYPVGPAEKDSGAAPKRRAEGESTRCERHAKRPSGAPWVPGCSDSRHSLPGPNSA